MLLWASEGGEGVFGARQVMAGFVLRELQKSGNTSTKKVSAHNPSRHTHPCCNSSTKQVEQMANGLRSHLEAPSR